MFYVICKFGMASNFNIIYVCNADVFPVLFCATAMGVCSFLARIFSAISPLISTIPQPTPMWIFCCVAILAGVLVLWVRLPDKEE